MRYDVLFFLNSILFGVGLAMDAFSVSIVNGLKEPEMRRKKRLFVAGTYAVFQTVMPLIGWFFVHEVVTFFSKIARFIPYAAFAVLVFLGVRMIVEAVRQRKEEETEQTGIGCGQILLQGVATSLDALSVGFTNAEYPFHMALTEALIIGAVTFGFCLAGVFVGRKFGERYRKAAPIVGGVILILIGIEILVKSFFA